MQIVFHICVTSHICCDASQLVEEMQKPAVTSDAQLTALDTVSWEAKYVSLLLELAAARNHAELRIKPEMLVFSMSGTSKLGNVTKVVSLEKKAAAMECTHKISLRWASGTDGFKRGLRDLSNFQLESIQLKATGLVKVSEILRSHFTSRSSICTKLRHRYGKTGTTCLYDSAG
jgi:hypothetical protein